MFFLQHQSELKNIETSSWGPLFGHRNWGYTFNSSSDKNDKSVTV